MLSVREMQASDIPSFVKYWLNADHDYLKFMGVEVSKLPTEENLISNLTTQLATPIEQKTSYCIIWENDGEAIGHCNTNPSLYGQEANMHLHLWTLPQRKKGMGTQLVQMSLPYFFNNLKLKTLWCEPNALNAAPNKTLQKAGFRFIKEYITSPGFFCFEQPVKRWMMTCEDYATLSTSN